LKSNLAALKTLDEEVVDTPHGRVFLRCGLLPGVGVRIVFVQRHDATPRRVYTQPADINYAAIALALQMKVRADGRRRCATRPTAVAHAHREGRGGGVST